MDKFHALSIRPMLVRFGRLQSGRDDAHSSVAHRVQTTHARYTAIRSVVVLGTGSLHAGLDIANAGTEFIVVADDVVFLCFVLAQMRFDTFRFLCTRTRRCCTNLALSTSVEALTSAKKRLLIHSLTHFRKKHFLLLQFSLLVKWYTNAQQ